MSYFQDLAAIENPGKAEILEFLVQTEKFLNGVVNFNIEDADLSADPPPLFTRELQELAQAVFRKEVARSFNDLRMVINDMSEDHREFIAHGLIGAPQHFKFKILGHLEKAKETFAKIWRWVKKMLILIDAILKSIADAAKPIAGFGVGGAIIECKDALISLT